MTDPQPTNGTYPDAELTTPSNYNELIEARAAVIKAGLVLERALGLPIEKRQILDRELARHLKDI